MITTDTQQQPLKLTRSLDAHKNHSQWAWMITTDTQQQPLKLTRSLDALKNRNQWAMF
jgi:hypothetical protein